MLSDHLEDAQEALERAEKLSAGAALRRIQRCLRNVTACLDDLNRGAGAPIVKEPTPEPEARAWDLEDDDLEEDAD